MDAVREGARFTKASQDSSKHVSRRSLGEEGTKKCADSKSPKNYMKKFLVLYNAPVEVMEKWSNMSEEDQKKAMDGWKKWGEGHKDDFADFGAPVGKNKRVTKDGATNVRNEVGGYSVMHAESHEDAVKIVSDSPHFDPEGTYIEVMELMDM